MMTNGAAAEAGDAMTLLQRKLAALLKEADPELRSLLQRTWLLGPRRIGPNVLCSSAPGIFKCVNKCGISLWTRGLHP